MTKDDVVQAVCEVCGIMPSDLRKRSRKEPLPTARALITHYLYRELNLSPRDIVSDICFPVYGRTAVYHYLPRGRTLIELQAAHNKALRATMERVDRILQARTAQWR